MAKETWKAVVGWEGVYEVSDLARVRRVVDSGKGRSGDIMTSYMDNCGRMRVRLRDHGKVAEPRVYVLVAAAFLGPCPEGREVNHKDHCRTNDVLENLEYVTRSENMLHSYRNGRKRPTKPRKLTVAKIATIIDLVLSGRTKASVAREFGVCPSHVGRIFAKRRNATQSEVTNR